MKRKKTPCAIVCGKQEKLGSNIFENVSPITNPAVTTANILKLDTGTITEVHLTQANLLNIGQAQHTGNPAGLHIAAAPAGPHAENPAATTANGHKLDPETSIVGVTAVLHDTQDPADSTANKPPHARPGGQHRGRGGPPQHARPNCKRCGKHGSKR